MNERQLKILELLKTQGSLEVAALSGLLGVSGVTVRKDLSALEGKGLLRRQHGSALPVSSNDIAYRMTIDYELKRRIARRACEMVGRGETVMIESGSTCAMLAEELAQKQQDVTIVTNSAFIADHIRSLAGVRIVLLGGNYDPEAQIMSGPLTRLCVKEFYVDKFFIGTDGYDKEQGFSNVDLVRAETVRFMAERSTKRIILTNSAKFGRRGVVSLMPTRDVSAVVTDSLPEAYRTSLEENNVEIILA